MSECVRFCEGCPRVPKGVLAEVVGIEFMNRRTLPGFRSQESEKGELATLIARIDTVAVESTNRDIQEGDEGTLFVLAGSLTRNDLKEKIADCQEPKKSMLKGTRCQAIQPDEVIQL